MTLTPLPEVRNMIVVAQRYILGEASIIDLYGAACECARWAGRLDYHPEIISLALKWGRMANDTWNEWGLNKNPMSESELREELRRDLNMK